MRSLAFIPTLLLFAGCGGRPAAPQAEWPTSPGVLRVSPTAQLDFGAVSALAEATAAVTVTNDGGRPLTARLEIRGPGAARFSIAGEAARTLDPGARERVAIAYRGCDAATAAADPCRCPERLDSALLHVTTDDGDAATPTPTPIALFAETRPASPRVSIDPAARVRVASDAPAEITIRNSGCGRLQILRLDVTAPGGERHAAADELFTSACDRWPCRPNVEVCADGDDRCPSTHTISLGYENANLAQQEQFALRVRTNDPLTPERVVLVEAEADEACPPATAQILQVTARPCVNQPVTLRARVPSEAAGVAWRFAFSPPPVPVLRVEGDAVTFVPERDGVYILQAEPEGTCGPPVAATRAVQVTGRGCS